MTLEDWPDCKIDGCHNKCCIRLGSDLCYPHTLEHDADVLNEAAERADELRRREMLSAEP